MSSVDEWIPSEALRDAVVRTAASNGPAAAADLVGKHWDRYVATAPRSLLDAVRALPGSVFVDNPGMVVAANYLQHVVVDGSPARFEQAHHLASVQPRPDGELADRLIGLTGTTATARTRGDLTQATATAAEARRLLDAASDAEVAPMRSNLPHLFLQWGRSLEAAGVGGPVAFEYEEAFRTAVATDQPQIARRAAAHLAWYSAERGHLATAEEWLRRALGSGEPNPRYDAVLHLADALVSVDRDDRRAAGVALARMSVLPTGEYWAAALWVRSWLAADRAARAILGAEFTDAIGRAAPATVAAGANRWYVRGAASRVGVRVDRFPGDAPEDLLLDAVGAYRAGDADRASELTGTLLEGGASMRVRAYALVVSAAAAVSRGRATLAQQEFGHAVEVIRQQGLGTAYGLAAPAHLRLLTDGAATAAPRGSRPAHDPDDLPAKLAALTRRERELLLMLASDRPPSAIAEALFISPNTVKATTRRIYRKLGVHSRREAVEAAQVIAGR